ncbi:MAG: AAA family ATPase [Kiritimatiellales bacterium]|nr:AAA family ATPase [Kiritimatiellales bacterium]
MKEYISFVDRTSQGDFEFVDGSNEHLFVGPISTVNILVGANNSRKSRFMRMLVMLDHIPTVDETLKDALQAGIKMFDQLISKVGNDELFNVQRFDANSIISSQWLPSFKNFKENTTKEDRIALFNHTLEDRSGRMVLDSEELSRLRGSFIKLSMEKADGISIDYGAYRKIADFFELLYQNQHQTMRIGGDNNPIAFDLISKLQHEFMHIYQKFAQLIESTEKQEIGQDKIFIPSLRGSLPLCDSGQQGTMLPNAIYEDTTVHYYFSSNGGLKQNRKFKISAGDRLHHTILMDRNSTFEKRERFQQFQGFISTSFFNERRVEVVAEPNTKTKEIRFYIASESERKIQDLGDGIQHLLILLYPIFMADANTWIFIDEPELSLHPGFQNLFIDTILNNKDLKAKSLRYFLTTHSNHFLSHALREPNNISVFNFSPINKDKSIIRCVHGADTTVLDQLGVENASVYMANCSIWVEGVSDRRYVQAFLSSYCKATGKREFKEGLDYTFFEYAGSNIRHYLFDPETVDKKFIDSFRNANRIFLLADQDMSQEKQGRHKELEKLNSENFEYKTTIVLEIENLLPPEIIQDFIQSHQSQQNVSFTAKLDDYSQEPMGKFLKENSGEQPLEYGDRTLTTGHKNELSQLVLDKEYEWTLLSTSPELKCITEAVYGFIEKHNSSNYLGTPYKENGNRPE